MIRLFEIDESYELQLNKEWILMVPAFAQIIKKDKGSEGDYRGDKKLMARKKLAYIYLMLDFFSPLRDMDEMERRERAMEWQGIGEPEVNDPDVINAMNEYRTMLYHSSRALKTLTSMKKGINQMDDYFEHVDFEAVDKQGKLKYDPGAYAANIKKMHEAYVYMDKFEEMVTEQLSANKSVRGDIELGEFEGDRSKFTEMMSAAANTQAKKLVRNFEEEEQVDVDTGEVIQLVDRRPKKVTGAAFSDYGHAVRQVTDSLNEETEE